MKAMRFAVLGMAALFVAACLPVTTKNPVGTTAGVQAGSESIVGVWKSRSDKDDKDDKLGVLAFLNAEDGNANDRAHDRAGQGCGRLGRLAS